MNKQKNIPINSKCKQKINFSLHKMNTCSTYIHRHSPVELAKKEKIKFYLFILYT
jgi:hypothetical protein